MVQEISRHDRLRRRRTHHRLFVERRSEAGGPSKTVTGETLAWISDPASPNTSVPGVLYEDLNGMKGFGYYHQPAQHVQFFLKDDEVIALLIDVPKR